MNKKPKTSNEDNFDKLIRLCGEVVAIATKIKYEAEAEKRKQWGEQIDALRAAHPERAHPDGHFYID